MDAPIETDNKEEDERRKAKAAAEAIPDEQKIAAATAELAAARGSLPAGFKVVANEFEKESGPALRGGAGAAH